MDVHGLIVVFTGKVQPKKEITEDLQLYYDNVTNAILGFDEEVMKVEILFITISLPL